MTAAAARRNAAAAVLRNAANAVRRAAAAALLLPALATAASPDTTAATAATPEPRPGAPARLTLEPFVLKTFDGTEHAAELGRLRVPEDRSRPDGRGIAVAFVRLKSTAAAPGPPVVFLAGGPGVPGTLLGRVPVYFRLFERLRELGDVILLDQRGTGISEPTLQCAAKASLPLDAFESEAKAAAAIGGILRPCVKLVRGDGFAPEAYTTDASADDLEDLRTAIGAERIRLIGMSYGTELALAAIRRHGAGIDRVVLAGTRGPDHVWKLPTVLDFALRRFSRLVAADPVLRPSLPDLEGAVRRMAESLAWRPATVRVTDSKTRETVPLKVGPVGLQAVIQNDISDGRAYGSVPAMVASLARGDSTLFARRIEQLYNGLGAGISVMAVAVDCASGGTPERIARVERERRGSVLGGVKNLLLNPAFCDLVGRPDLGPEARAPIFSDVPALFVTGEHDGITPPAQAEEVLWGFPRGVHVLVENGWHETLPAPAVQELVLDFLRGADVKGQRLRLEAPRFLSVEEAKAAPAPNR